MEQAKPGYAAPAYPIQPMPMPTPMPMPAPQVKPSLPPVMEKPVYNDIHLHASYQQTSILFPPQPKPQPKPHTHAVVCANPYQSAGAILVLFILLVIISRGFRKC